MPSTLAERSYLLGDQTLLTIEDEEDEGEGIFDPKYVRRQKIYNYSKIIFESVLFIVIIIGIFTAIFLLLK